MKKLLIILFGISASLLTSCSDDHDTNPTPNPPAGYSVPETYTFTDAEGNSTVNFSGQVERQDQLAEIETLMKSANTAGTAISAQDLKDMFANVNNNGNGNFTFESSKQLRNKCATEFTDAEEVRLEFEIMMESLAAISQTTTPGESNGGNGIAGIVQSGDAGPYLMDANGQEYTQLISKGLMGAVFYHQITGYYLTDEKIGDGVDNSAAVNEAEGKYYTAMEHHWDEAFGYFTDATNFPLSGTDRFWGEYSNVVDPALGSNEILMNAFLRGRAAISNDDMTTKNEQRDIIINEMERVVAGAAIHYMNKARDQFANDARRNHYLSEGMGFINGLRFNPSASLSPQEISALKSEIGNNFYDVTVSDILSVRDQLSAAFEMESVKNDL